MLKALRPKVDAIYGTSTGALNALGFSFLGADGLCLKWKAIDSINKVFKSNGISALWKSGLYNSEPLFEILENMILNNKPLPVSITTTRVNLETGGLDYRVIDTRRIAEDPYRAVEAVLSSAAIPGVVEPVGGLWSDGGIREVAPLKKAIEDGVDKITVLLTAPMAAHSWDKTSYLPFGIGMSISVAFRAIDLMLHEILVRDLHTCATRSHEPGYRPIELEVYGPEGPLWGGLDFSHSAKGVEWGMTRFRRYNPLTGEEVP